jgi:hypothetical protein
MCLRNQQLDPENRRRLAMGNGCLAASLILMNYLHPDHQIWLNLAHGVGGVLLGISLAVNMRVLWAARCIRQQVQ